MAFEAGWDTTNYGDRFELRDYADWLKTGYVAKAKASGEDVGSALSDVIDWAGTAGQNFRADAGVSRNELRDLEDAGGEIEGALRGLADELEKVSDKLVEAEGVAREAGVTVTMGANSADKIESMILPPKEPTSPESVVDSWRGKPRDWVKQHEDQLQSQYDKAVAAGRDYSRKIIAYNSAGDKVKAARKSERSAHGEFRGKLKKAMTDVAEFYSNAKMGGNVSLSALSSAQGGRDLLSKKADELRLLATELSGAGEVQEKTYLGKRLTDADKALVAKWISYRTHAYGNVLEQSDTFASRAASIDRWLNRVPVGIRKAIEKDPTHFLQDIAYSPNDKPGVKHRGAPGYKKGAQLILKSGKATKVLRGVPILGTTLSVAQGVGDVALGEDPVKVATKTVLGTLGSMGGGAIAGATATGFGASGPVTVGAIFVGGFVGGFGADAAVEAAWPDEIEKDFDLHVYRDDETDRRYGDK